MASANPASLPEKMKAALFDGIGQDIYLGTIAIPEIGDDDALVEVTASGICRSDWHMWTGDWDWVGLDPRFPSVLGHEVGGVIAAVGQNVKTLKVGDRITTPFGHGCGRCGNCKRARQNICDDIYFPSLHGTGGWAQYMRIRGAELNAVKLPDNVDELAAAALGCRYMTAWHAVRDMSKLKGGETMAVVGCGGVGLAAVEIAVALGAQVVAVDLDDRKLARARELGAYETVNGAGLSPEAVGKAVKSKTPGDIGADIALDAMGGSKTTLSAMYSLRKGGHLTLVGMTSKEDRGFVAMPADLIVQNEWTIQASLGNPSPGFHDLLGMVAAGRLNPTGLVTRQVKLSETMSVLSDMANYKTDGYVIITDLAN